MQKTTPLRKAKASARYTQQTQSSVEINHFPLKDLLPAGHMLALNTSLGTLSQLSCDESGPRLIAEQQFTTSEVCVLLPLLKSYPHYCPYEILLASFNSGNVTEQLIASCRQRLQDAQLNGVWDQEMRPVRNVLSRTRLKLHTFGIDIFSILETGYVLMRKSRQRQIRAV
ncbi:MAG: hypothetical protein M3Y81_12000 [Chloroflexota bacterium]|nr:hypothetical protein [Chloroflexota bacterium]